jgi:hypothetical protein
MPINREVVRKTDIEDKLFKYLQSLGYQTISNAKLTGKSSIEHTFDLLAQAEDGIINSSIAIRVVDSDVKEKQSHTIFNFVNKAYDVGIPERIMITIPDFNQKSIRLARQWNIRIFNAKKVDALIAAKIPANKTLFQSTEPVKYDNVQEMTDSLIRRGYRVQENAIITGFSGITYKFDLIASIGTALWSHNIGIDFLTNKEEVSLEQVSIFDSKAYDSGIVTKIIVAKPGLNFNAKLLAGRQRIKVFELGREQNEISAGDILEMAMVNPSDIQAMDAINSSYSSPSNSDNQIAGISSEKETPADEKPVSKRKSVIFSEIETNLKIASEHNVYKPVLFQTNLWDKNHDEINELPSEIRSELGEVYNKMCVINNLVWLITEVGDTTGELSATYIELCESIASRLTKILDHT